MRGFGSAFGPLIAALRGDPAPGTDWDAVIALANHTLLTPALFSSVARTGRLDRLPDDAREYLRFIHACNGERNLRLRGQLCEAVAALNDRGIAPTLLKGAVPLFLCFDNRLPDRITSDLDVAVEGEELASACACLRALGYASLAEGRGMVRPCDVGVLEVRAAGPERLPGSETVERDGLSVQIPSPQSRALHWIVHDLLKEGDYWRGRIGLRHLHDLAELAEREDVDWRALRNALPDHRARNALDTQLCTLHRLFGVGVPEESLRAPMARFQTWRRMLSAAHPVLGRPLRLAGNIAWAAWKVSHPGNLTWGRPFELARRGANILLDRDLRAKV